jgi:glutathione S-transferase
MQFYYHPVSSYSQKAQIALHEVAAPYTPMLIALFKPDVAEQYRRLYPLGKVPLLVLDDGTQVAESTIIIEYLNDSAGNSPLIPTSAERARQVRYLDRVCDLYLNDTMATILFDGWKPVEQREPGRVATALRTLSIVCPQLDRELESRPWLAGDTFSMADCAAAPALNYLATLPGFALSDWPHLAAFLERLRARPSFQRVLEEAAPHWHQLVAARAG